MSDIQVVNGIRYIKVVPRKRKRIKKQKAK